MVQELASLLIQMKKDGEKSISLYIMQKNIAQNPNEDAAEQIEMKKWSQIIAKTMGPHNKAAWMITTTSNSSHQSFDKITNPSSSSKGPQSALNQATKRHRHGNHIERNTDLNDTPQPQYFELGLDGLPNYQFYRYQNKSLHPQMSKTSKQIKNKTDNI